ncbi:MAG: glycosyltransferase family 2 protein [Acidobacteriia bacterium]|nr:glycosyltransferase family 2 protein [Terriglobia bacterium]
MPLPVSVLLPTHNCEATIRDTLESVKWADEILVVDSFSTDGTLDICRGYAARVIQHEYINSARQKNWAVPQCCNEWVLQMDSDEVLGPGAREEIEQAIAQASPNTHAFRLPRRNHFLGHWMRHGGLYPDYQIRLFRRDKGRWQDREVHAHLMASGQLGTLTHGILHSDAPCIAVRIRHVDRYTRYEADELRKRGRGFRWDDLVIRPWGAFFYRYFWLQGFRDGWRGFIYCAYMGIYVFLTRAKLWELEELNVERSPKVAEGWSLVQRDQQ